jgi:hypothetical protein
LKALHIWRPTISRKLPIGSIRWLVVTIWLRQSNNRRKNFAPSLWKSGWARLDSNSDQRIMRIGLLSGDILNQALATHGKFQEQWYKA